MYKTLCLMVLALVVVVFGAVISNELQHGPVPVTDDAVRVAGPVSEEYPDTPTQPLRPRTPEGEQEGSLSWNRAAALLFMGAYRDN